VGLRQWQELPKTLDVNNEALTARLERRVRYVLRQLERRIGEVETLSNEVASLRAELDRARSTNSVAADGVVIGRGELESLRSAAREHDALMSTKTMRALKWPRALYARCRRRRPVE